MSHAPFKVGQTRSTPGQWFDRNSVVLVIADVGVVHLGALNFKVSSGARLVKTAGHGDSNRIKRLDYIRTKQQKEVQNH